MAQFHYVEGMLLANGRVRECNEMPTREAGQSPESWLDDVRVVATAGVTCRKWDDVFAKDMVFCGELICLELKRFPSMVDWDQELYVAAVEGHIHPEDKDGMSLLTEPDFFGDDGPLDAETVAFLNDLAADDSDGARA
nr:hypothetical protein [uncultured Devosia sp.]